MSSKKCHFLLFALRRAIGRLIAFANFIGHIYNWVSNRTDKMTPINRSTFFRAFVYFCRPHTIIATFLQVGGLFVVSRPEQLPLSHGLPRLLLALAAALAANVYIVGLNQLTDVAIDRINKPYLPLASGAFSMRQGWFLTLAFGATALVLAAGQGAILFFTVFISMTIGTLYSLPPVRLKQYPLAELLAIAFVRGIVTNLGFFWHFQGTAGLWAWSIGWIALFFFGFGLVIGLYKDIPDLEGDRQHTIFTLAVRLGARPVFNLGRWLLTICYLLPIGFGLGDWSRPGSPLFVVIHLGLVAFFWWRSWQVDVMSRPEMTRFYLLLWALFYAEYLLLALYEW